MKKAFVSFRVIIIILVLFIALAMNSNQKTPETTLSLSTLTANTQDAGTKGNVYMTLNYDEENKYYLDTPNKSDRKRGMSDSYRFTIPVKMDDIETLSLHIESTDAWRPIELRVHFESEKRYSAEYIAKRIGWMSTEKRDQDRLHAKEAYIFQIGMKTYDDKKVPSFGLKKI